MICKHCKKESSYVIYSKMANHQGHYCPENKISIERFVYFDVNTKLYCPKCKKKLNKKEVEK